MNRPRPGGLCLLLPTPEETDLLRACLWSGPTAREAWERWRAGGVHGGLGDEAVKPLLPLLYHAVRRNDLAVEPRVRATLGAAALAETRRSAAYHRICARACAAVEEASVPFLVLTGAALGDTVYPAGALRHSHDVDLLVEARDLDCATEALRRGGFTPVPGRGRDVEQRELRDDSGLPIRLHSRLLPVRYYDMALDGIRDRAQVSAIAGRRLSTLSAADHLVHVCGLAACAGRGRSLKWVFDAWYLIARHPELDGQALLRMASDARAVLPLTVLLGYLADQLDARLPNQLVAGLAAAAARTDRTAREVALFGVRAGGRGTLRNLWWATRGWRDGADLVRWMLVPTPVSLRFGWRRHHSRPVAAGYVLRPLSYLLRRLGSWRAPPRRRPWWPSPAADSGRDPACRSRPR